MKKVYLTIGILGSLIFLSIGLLNEAPKNEDTLGEVTNPKDIDYIAPIDFNGSEITYTYTDDNTGEDLIIATDSATYSSWDSAYVNFAIKNISATDQNLKIQFLYDGGASASAVEEIIFDTPYQVTVEDRGSKDYTCDSGWQSYKADIPFPSDNIFTCGKEAPKHCDTVVKNTCTVDNDLLGTHQETRYKDIFVPIAKGAAENLKHFDEKVIDSKFVAKEQISNFIEAGQTKYYRAKIIFTPKSSGAFLINAYGDAGSFGTLDPWYSSSWLYRKSITIDETKVTGSSDLTSFPVLVDLTDSGLQANAQADGDDILFTSSDGTTKLDHEIELYTSSTGRIVAWVEIPTLSYNTNTVIYMYYGNSGASSQQNATGVWDSNYKGVWHMDDNAANTTVTDSIGVFNGTNSVNTDTKDAAGQIGGALDYTSGSSNYTAVTYGAGLSVGSAFTVQLWFKTSSTSGVPLSRWAGNYTGYGLYSDGNWYSGNGAAWTSVASGRVTDGSWNSYHVVYTGSNFISYKNGAQNATTALSGAANDTSNLNFGRDGRIGGAEYWTGTLDEIRFSNTNRSADWITTEYNNQSATSTFYTIGTQETDTARIPVMNLQGQMILQGQMKI